MRAKIYFSKRRTIDLYIHMERTMSIDNNIPAANLRDFKTKRIKVDGWNFYQSTAYSIDLFQNRIYHNTILSERQLTELLKIKPPVFNLTKKHKMGK